jgi:lipopolysaccharide/colanic/teichoic acid biosynthesis glycosyltransferase
MWPLNGRSDLVWDETMHSDSRYVENCSFALEIIWKTVSVLLYGSGA